MIPRMVIAGIGNKRMLYVIIAVYFADDCFLILYTIAFK